MGSGAGRARAALSRGDGEAERQRGRDHEPVRRGADDRRDRRRSRGGVRRHGARRRREGIRRACARAAVARAEPGRGGRMSTAKTNVSGETSRAYDAVVNGSAAGSKALAAANGSVAASGSEATAMIGPPLWLLCELTYRCPLHCVFSYNPLEMRATRPVL